MKKPFATVLALASLITPLATPVIACGPPPEGPAYIDVFGGETADLNAFYDGRVGVVTAQSPRARLFMAWRLLHHLPVGATAGGPLSVPCCGDGPSGAWDAASAWAQARGQVSGVTAGSAPDSERPGANYTSIPNCFAAAFNLATQTLGERVKAYGAGSPWVKAWLDGQDAVFSACGGKATPMPALDPGAPAWLKADRAYQEAAYALYAGQNADAAKDFAAIGRDAASPWAPMSPYLTARALLRQAIATKTAGDATAAEAAIRALANAPATTFGQGEAPAMAKTIGVRVDPARALATYDAELTRPTLNADAATDFRDYVDLNAKAARPAEIMDWIWTLKSQAPGATKVADDADVAAQAAQTKAAQAFSLVHAKQRWGATHDPAWLLAAMSLADPTDPDAPSLAAAAAEVAPSDPAYLSATYQRVRLTIAAAPAADTRTLLDQVLARGDLSTTDRNLFLGERMQVAASLAAFDRDALRARLCADDNDKSGCVRSSYTEQAEASGVYDAANKTGFGPDARALIDRMPLATRMAMVKDQSLPATLRLDLALTSWTRAVLMQDNPSIDALSVSLKSMLPQLSAEFARVASTAPGPDKRFAEFFILAKSPGMSTDLQGYTRPDGSIASWQGAWYDWMILPAGSTKGDSAPPCLLEYAPDGYCQSDPPRDVSDTALWPTSDIVCLTYCGAGAFPMRRPDFMAATLNQANAERARVPAPYDDTHKLGASVWAEVLTYAKAHPKDARSPEALYWLVHVTRYGHSHDHLSHQAFDILHQQFPSSPWTAKTKYYFD